MESVADKTSFTETNKFSDIFSPIFVKELRQGLRANQFVWPFILVQIAAIACVAVEWFTVFVAKGGGAEGWVFHTFLGIVFWGVLPLTLFGSLQPELSKGRNVELLLMSNLSRWQIALGKWGVGSVLSMLMLISLLPYAMFRYMIGNISDFTTELAWLGGVVAGNAIMNAVVIGASGFRNYVGRVFMILLSGGCAFGTACIIVVKGSYGTIAQFLWYLFAGLLATAVLVIINLQLGRARLRLYENPLDPPSSALIVILIICAPIIIGISRGMAFRIGDWGGITMAIVLLVLCLMIDPGPGKKQRKWAQA